MKAALDFSNGPAFVKSLLGDWKREVAVALSGEMGAGKTQLTKWLLTELGVALASSPTFSIHNQYESKKGLINHFDLYRLTHDSELDEVGFWDALRDLKSAVIVEWADRLPREVFSDVRPTLFLHLERSSEKSRLVTWEFQG